ncbi:hypothetical protein [Bradyrhizobium liaoningense]
MIEKFTFRRHEHVSRRSFAVVVAAFVIELAGGADQDIIPRAVAAAGRSSRFRDCKA